MERRSLTPLRIGLVLLAVMFLVPQAMSYSHDDFFNRTSFSLICFLWSISYSTEDGVRLLIVDPLGLLGRLLFFGLGFAFIYQVIQYCQEQAKRGSTLMVGIATICPMLFLVTIPYILMGFWVIFIPLPTLLITGLVFMHYGGPREPTTPWEGLN